MAGKPGRSGGPRKGAGRKPGVLNDKALRDTLNMVLTQEVTDTNTGKRFRTLRLIMEAQARKAWIERDTGAAEFLVNRRFGRPRNTVQFKLPKGGSAVEQMDAVFLAVSQGELTLEEGQMFIGMIAAKQQIEARAAGHGEVDGIPANVLIVKGGLPDPEPEAPPPEPQEPEAPVDS